MAIKKKKDESGSTDSKKSKSEESHKEDVFAEGVPNEPVSEDKGNVTVEATEEIEIVEEEVVADVTKDEAVMPVADVEDLLKKMEERLKNQFDSKLRAANLNNAKAEMSEGQEYVADLEDDWLDSPVVFFAYSFNFSIHGDNARGKQTTPPHGALKFKPIIRSKRQGVKGVEVISVSSIKVNSKAVVAYMRNHSYFGISFFESLEDVLTLDTSWAQRLIEANQSIQRFSDQQVISRSRQEGLAIGTDIVQMRKDLIATIAQKSIRHQEEMRNGALTRSVIDKKTDRAITESNIAK
jgi:hypothetical protein